MISLFKSWKTGIVIVFPGGSTKFLIICNENWEHEQCNGLSCKQEYQLFCSWNRLSFKKVGIKTKDSLMIPKFGTCTICTI